MYEKELALVSDNSQLKIDKLEKENSELRNRDAEHKEGRVLAQQIDARNAQETRNVLKETKAELEAAAKTIKQLHSEIKVQQDWYEKELAKLRKQIQIAIDPDSEHNQEKLSEKQSHEAAIQQCLVLRKKLNDSIENYEELSKQVSFLSEELKLQEQHFMKEIEDREKRFTALE